MGIYGIPHVYIVMCIGEYLSYCARLDISIYKGVSGDPPQIFVLRKITNEIKDINADFVRV